VIEDMVQDMSLTSQTEGADKVLVDPPMPEPEGEVVDTNDDSGDQAQVETVVEPQPPSGPDPAPNPILVDKQVKQGMPPDIDQTSVIQIASIIQIIVS
jgi:hypothetical protein